MTGASGALLNGLREDRLLEMGDIFGPERLCSWAATPSVNRTVLSAGSVLKVRTPEEVEAVCAAARSPPTQRTRYTNIRAVIVFIVRILANTAAPAGKHAGFSSRHIRP